MEIQRYAEVINMDDKRIITIALAFLMLMSVIVSGATAYVEENDYTVREPIRIDGNSDFASQATAEGWPGDGSEGDPYVIEGYEIDGTGYGYGIYVGNTTVHFVVRGCYVHNASGVEWKSDNGISTHKPIYNSGIILFNASNGLLGDNILFNNVRGIKLFDSSSNSIENNMISNNSSGISLTISHHNTIIHNEINGTSSRSGGIYLQHSNDNTIKNNTISNHNRGIFEDTCDRNLIEDNIFVNNEIDFLSVYEYNGPPPDLEDENDDKNRVFISLIYVSIAVAILMIVLLIWKCELFKRE